MDAIFHDHETNPHDSIIGPPWTITIPDYATLPTLRPVRRGEATLREITDSNPPPPTIWLSDNGVMLLPDQVTECWVCFQPTAEYTVGCQTPHNFCAACRIRDEAARSWRGEASRSVCALCRTSIPSWKNYEVAEQQTYSNYDWDASATLTQNRKQWIAEWKAEWERLRSER